MATKKRLSPILNLKIFLMPSYEKSPSFKVIACSVWSSEPFTGLEVKNTPSLPVVIGLMSPLRAENNELFPQETNIDKTFVSQKPSSFLNLIIMPMKRNFWFFMRKIIRN